MLVGDGVHLTVETVNKEMATQQWCCARYNNVDQRDLLKPATLHLKLWDFLQMLIDTDKRIYMFVSRQTS